MSIELGPDENDALAMALTVTTLRLPARRLILRKGCRARKIFFRLGLTTPDQRFRPAAQFTAKRRRLAAFCLEDRPILST
jgi:hypothetical protein